MGLCLYIIHRQLVKLESVGRSEFMDVSTEYQRRSSSTSQPIDSFPPFTRHRVASRPFNIPLMYSLVFWNNFQKNCFKLVTRFRVYWLTNACKWKNSKYIFKFKNLKNLIYVNILDDLLVWIPQVELSRMGGTKTHFMTRVPQVKN